MILLFSLIFDTMQYNNFTFKYKDETNSSLRMNIYFLNSFLICSSNAGRAESPS
jgi:hypothetical protein